MMRVSAAAAKPAHRARTPRRAAPTLLRAAALTRMCADAAKICCVVVAACNCGATFKGRGGKEKFSTHQKKCKAGAAPLLGVIAAS